jgi:hypothetical protein
MRGSEKRYRLSVALWLALAAAVAFAVPSAQAADAPIGQIKTASGAVTILRDAQRATAKVGGAVFAKDVIATGADGSIGITFTDNTVMSAGPNSEVALEEYRFDSSNFTGGMLANMRSGTLSFVSGDIARSTPGAMKVKTPTAILGVRGTRFLVQVGGAQ